ncbi:MAG: hydrogenase maturation nickel metallochaperone HypA [Desulfotignum sp.]
MHEMGIAQELVEIALNALPADLKDPKVASLNLRIGKLSSVVPHSLTFCFEIITKDTPLEHARLNIEMVPVVIRCDTCGRQWEAETPVFRCPDCDPGQVRLISGREIDIDSLTLLD